MAATQQGTGGLTVGGQAAVAATYVTVPSNTIVESVSVNRGGSPDFEDQLDADGAHHTRITYEKSMHTATVVLVGIAYAADAGALAGAGSDYYVESVSVEKAKNVLRTTVNVTHLPTA